MEEKIQTLHPLGKVGRNIDKDKYDLVKEAILAELGKGELTHGELFEKLEKSLRED